MSARLTALLPTFALALLASLVSASPTAKPANAGATAVCPTPTKDQCKDSKYLLSDCGQQHLADCKSDILARAKKDPARAKAPATKVMKPNGYDIPGDVLDGTLRRSYDKPKKGRSIEVAGKSVLARSGLTKAPGLALTYDAAAIAHRNPDWDANGETIKSCEEYAYEQLYDGMRYIDSVGACAGDYDCEARIAFLDKTPGIARRTLKRKDGAKLATQLWVSTSGNKFPKNEMFMAPASIAYAVDPVSDGKKGADGRYRWKRTAEMDELNAILDKGSEFYSYGCSGKCNKRQFKDEWGFHEQLRARNPLSDAEFAEYERRKAEYRELYDAWAASAAAGRYKILGGDRKAKATDLVGRVTPLDMVSDPVERIDTMREQIQVIEADQGKLKGSKLDVPNAANAPAPQGSLAPAGVLAAPVAKRPTATKTGPRVTISRCSPLHWTEAGLDPEIMDFAGGGPASCRMADFLKAELARKKAGQKSCLDLGDDDCDWSPTTFHGRFVSSFPYGEELQGFEDECFQWTGGTIDVKNLKAAEKYIADMKKLVGEALAVVGGYRESQLTVEDKKVYELGGKWVDSESHGDKDWFAAGYDYDIGWHIEPEDLTNDKLLCDFNGKAHGAFGVDAWLIGSSKSVVDGSMYLTANEGNSGKATLSANLTLLGAQLLSVPKDTFSTAWVPEDESDMSVQIPGGAKPSFQFMAGPIPITGSVWGSLLYGVAASADAKLHSSTSKCDAKNVKFTLSGTLSPILMLSGYAQVGVGVTGLVSAGIRGTLNLVTLSTPFTTKLAAKSMTVDGNPQAAVAFDASLDLVLSTLSGSISLYIEFFFASEEWNLFKWSGVSDQIALIDPAIRADLPLVGWPSW